jgi:3'-5' exoribonuclease
MQLLTLTQLKRFALEGRVEARVHVQIESIQKKETREQKPFWEVIVVDAQSRLSIKAWSDSPGFKQCDGLEKGGFLEVVGEFVQNPNFGLEAKRWTCRALTEEEKTALLGGPEELRGKQSDDYAAIEQIAATIADPRLRGIVNLMLADFGERYRRAAAARTYHHARRGGLVEHTAQMLRTADAIAALYPGLNRDLLLAGVLFHDFGKLWENCPEANGFAMPFDERGELIGHITLGIEALNNLWRKLLASPEASAWSELEPANEDVRNHLIHLIASHHGELEFGSPVSPKTPEAWALHHIDNLDAKLEMMFTGFGTTAQLAPRIFERVRPLPGNLVKPLDQFFAPEVK